jgi:hypothetical protein
MESNRESVDRSVTMPADWWKAIETKASEQGISVSAWLANAAKTCLPVEIGMVLSAKRSPGRPRVAGWSKPLSWRETCDICRKNPKPEGGKICEMCQPKTKKVSAFTQSMFCRCDLPFDASSCVCGSLQQFEDWQIANPE